MRARLPAALAVLTALSVALPLGGCDSEPEEETPSVLRIRFETEMKTILRDLKAAQETAAANEGHYLGLDELRSRYLSRPIPDSYALSMEDVSAQAFNASIVHGTTGIECRLEVGLGAPGIPRCE